MVIEVRSVLFGVESIEFLCFRFGACIVDLLDSYLSAKYHLEACYNGSLVKSEK